MTTRPRPEQLRHVQELRETLDALPDNIPDAYLDQLVDLTHALQTLIEIARGEVGPPVFVHARDRE